MIKTSAALAACVNEYLDGPVSWGANDDAPAVALSSVLAAIDDESAKYRAPSSETQKAYTQARKYFCAWAVVHGVRTVSQITLEVLLAYAQSLRDAGKAGATIELWAGHIRRLVLDAAAYGRANSIDGRLVRWVPARDAQASKPHARQALTPDEVQAVLAVAERRGLRALALVHLALCGLRTKEIAGLNVGDVDVEGARVRITGKGRVEPEWVTVPRETATMIHAYLGNERPGATDDDSLWGARSAAWVRIQLRAILGDAGLRRPGICPHSFRHTAATFLLAHGVPLAHVSQYLRHSEPATTMRYAHDLGATSTAAALAPLVTGALTDRAQAVHQ